MRYLLRYSSLLALVFLLSSSLWAQDSTAFNWNVTSKKMSEGVYELSFKTDIKNGWQLYAPNQLFTDIHSVELSFADSLIKADTVYAVSGEAKKISNKIFDNASYKIYDKEALFTTTVRIKGTIPSMLMGEFKYTYGKADEFYPLVAFSFSVKMEGGVSNVARIKINSIDLKHPVNSCGDDSTEGKGLTSIFLLGLIGGFIALLTPCVFPLIPLTVSFFTKRAANRKKRSCSGHALWFFYFPNLYIAQLAFPFIGSYQSGDTEQYLYQCMVKPIVLCSVCCVRHFIFRIF